MRKLTVLSIAFFFSGCIGVNLIQPTQMKPWTLLKGDQLGRDQLANRMLVADFKVPLKGLDTHQVLTVLGQPQEINVIQRDVSEDWYFVYYRRYKTQPETPEGRFAVRFYHDKVIDVVKEA